MEPEDPAATVARLRVRHAVTPQSFQVQQPAFLAEHRVFGARPDDTNHCPAHRTDAEPAHFMTTHPKTFATIQATGFKAHLSIGALIARPKIAPNLRQ